MRPDRREATELRGLSSAQGLLSRTDGSARFTLGDTCVICGVYGPMDVKQRNERMDRSTVEVSFQPVSGDTSPADRLVEHSLRRVAEATIVTSLHPRTLIRIVVQVMCDDGDVVCCAINAMVMALVDAGVPMRHLVAAVGCLIDREGQLLLDPLSLEANGYQSIHSMAFAPDSLLLLSQSVGVFQQDEVKVI